MKYNRIFFSMILVVTLFLVGCSSTQNNNITHTDPSNGELNESTNDNISTKNDNKNAANILYQVLIYDYSDSVPSAKHEIEYVFADNEKYSNTTPDDIVQLMINGINYSGRYQSSQYREYNYFPVSQYVDENGLSFEIDDSGTMTSCFWGNASLQGAEKTKDKCVAIAREFLASIVDIGNYDIDVVEDSEREMYKVSFTKKIGNFKTTDAATIVIKNDGNLYSYSSFMLGKVSDKSVSADSIDLKEVEEAINNKLSAVYRDATNNYSRVEFGEKNLMLTMLKDGKTGIICTVDVDCVKSDGEFETTVSERINCVVLID